MDYINEGGSYELVPSELLNDDSYKIYDWKHWSWWTRVLWLSVDYDPDLEDGDDGSVNSEYEFIDANEQMDVVACWKRCSVCGCKKKGLTFLQEEKYYRDQKLPKISVTNVKYWLSSL